MNRTLFFSIVIGVCLVAGDSFAQDRGNDRGGRGGFGGPPGDNRGGQGRGGFGGPPGGERRGGGRRPNFMQFLPVLMALDADKNGEISSKELANATAALKTLDKNGDGKLTEDEVRPERPPSSRGRGGFGGGDRGGAGGPPGSDRGGQGRGGFGGPPGSDRGGQGRGGFGGPPGGQNRGGGRPSAAEMTERMMAFDKNKDGKLTTDEVSERMHPMLKEADTDGDGAASKAEISKLAEKRAGQGGRRSEGRRGDQGGTQKPQRPAFDN